MAEYERQNDIMKTKFGEMENEKIDSTITANEANSTSVLKSTIIEPNTLVTDALVIDAKDWDLKPQRRQFARKKEEEEEEKRKERQKKLKRKGDLFTQEQKVLAKPAADESANCGTW